MVVLKDPSFRIDISLPCSTFQSQKSPTTTTRRALKSPAFSLLNLKVTLLLVPVLVAFFVSTYTPLYQSCQLSPKLRTARQNLLVVPSSAPPKLDGVKVQTAHSACHILIIKGQAVNIKCIYKHNIFYYFYLGFIYNT